jgi:hypothetical protein
MNDSNRGRGRGTNPWNRYGGRSGQNQNRDTKKKTSSEVSAQNRFQEAQARLQASVQKHIKQDYDSSSEEEDLESDNILGKRPLCFVGLSIRIMIIDDHPWRQTYILKKLFLYLHPIPWRCLSHGKIAGRALERVWM